MRSGQSNGAPALEKLGLHPRAIILPAGAPDLEVIWSPLDPKPLSSNTAPSKRPACVTRATTTCAAARRSLIHRFRLRPGEDFLKARIIAQRVPLPALPQVGHGAI